MKKISLIFLLIFLLIFYSCGKDDPVSPTATAPVPRLDGNWDFTINTATGIFYFQTVNSLISGTVTINGFGTTSISGNFNDSALNFKFRSNETFGWATWKFNGQYDLSKLRMAGLCNVYKDANDSLIYPDISWFATKQQ